MYTVHRIGRNCGKNIKLPSFIKRLSLQCVSCFTFIQGNFHEKAGLSVGWYGDGIPYHIIAKPIMLHWLFPRTHFFRFVLYRKPRKNPKIAWFRCFKKPYIFRIKKNCCLVCTYLFSPLHSKFSLVVMVWKRNKHKNFLCSFACIMQFLLVWQ